MRIGALLSRLFHPSTPAAPAGPRNTLPELLPSRIQAGATAAELEDLRVGLDRISQHPCGDILLQAMRTYSELVNDLPVIVLMRASDIPDTRQPADAGSRSGAAGYLRDGVWHVNPAVFRDGPIEESLSGIAQLYEALARPRTAQFHVQHALRLPMPSKTLEKSWAKYCTRAEPSEQRSAAVGVVRQWMAETASFGGLTRSDMISMLDRIALGDTTPPRPSTLDLSNLGLQRLLRLPDTVQSLNLDNNRLGHLDGVSRGLRELRMRHNELNDLNAIFLVWNLPPGLERLDLSGNQLRRLHAGGLPAALKHLSISHNRFYELPSPLPDGLLSLNAAENYLERVSALPPNLTQLDLTGNLIADPPVAALRLAGCDLGQLGNQYVLPGVRAPRSASGSIPLGRAHASALPDTAAPMPAATVTKDTMVRTVGKWLDNGHAKALARWKEIAAEDNAGDFHRFLEKLCKSKSHKNAQFRSNVAEWLDELARPERASLRVRSFAACADAATTCEDRAAWTMNQLTAMRIDDDVAHGLYDDDPVALLNLGRQLFRLQVLTDIAIEKERALAERTLADTSLPQTDPIEVHLAYQVHLRDALDLALVVPEMMFYGAAGINWSDLEAARAAVLRREADEFPAFLCVDWSGWATTLTRLAPDAYADAMDRRYEALETHYETTLTSRLHALGMPPDDEDARRELGPVVAREIDCAIMAEVSRQFLTARGAADVAARDLPIEVTGIPEWYALPARAPGATANSTANA